MIECFESIFFVNLSPDDVPFVSTSSPFFVLLLESAQNDRSGDARVGEQAVRNFGTFIAVHAFNGFQMEHIDFAISKFEGFFLVAAKGGDTTNDGLETVDGGRVELNNQIEFVTIVFASEKDFFVLVFAGAFEAFFGTSGKGNPSIVQDALAKRGAPGTTEELVLFRKSAI